MALGRLGSIRFWLALLLITGWAGQTAWSQQTRQPPIYAPTNTGPPSAYGLLSTIRQGGRAVPVGKTKFGPGDLPVLLRPRPGYDPLGLRLGSFLMFPDLRISEFYDDNILFSASNPIHDFVTEIAPSLNIRSDWSEDLLSFEARAAIGRYWDHTNSNYEDYGVSLKDRFAITEASYFDSEFSYDRRHSDRESPDDTTGVHPTEYNDFFGNTGFFQQLGRFTLRLDGTVRRLDYLNDTQITAGVVVPVDNSDRDRNQILGTARIGYQIRRDIEAYVQGSYGVIHYDTSPDDNGFRRDARTYDAITGIAIDWNGVFETDVYVGYLAQTADDSRFDRIDGVDFGGKLAWNVTRRTTFSASLGRDTRVTSLANAAGSLATEASLAVDHELLRNLLLHLGGKWRENDFSGIDRTDDTFDIEAGASYFIMRNFVVGASYDYRQRNSNVPNAEFTRNLVMLNLELRF